MSQDFKRVEPLNLLQTLLNPDREELELGDKVLVAKAANILQVGEFQLLQLAYRDWHNEDLPESRMSRMFSVYMLENVVPHWAQHYARKIIDDEAAGALNLSSPNYHCYDHDYHTSVPGGVRRFWLSVAVLSVTMGGAIGLSDLTVVKAASMFPPYLDEEDLNARTPAPYGRADVIPASLSGAALQGQAAAVKAVESRWPGYTAPSAALPAPP